MRDVEPAYARLAVLERTSAGTQTPAGSVRLGLLSGPAGGPHLIGIARGELIHPTAASAASYMGDLNLAHVPITGMPPLRSALVWRRPGRDLQLCAFVRVARQVLRAGQPGGAARAIRRAARRPSSR